MAKECKAYKSDTGAVFDTLHEAQREDLRMWLLRESGGAINECIATKLTNAIAADLGMLKTFTHLVTEIYATHPARLHAADTTQEAIEDGLAAMYGERP